MRAFTIILILLSSLFELSGQTGNSTIIQSPQGQYFITADCINGDGYIPYCKYFKLYKMPLNCNDFVKINASYPIYWSPDDSFFVCVDKYYNIPKIKIFNTQGFITDSILNGDCPFIYGKEIYYYYFDRDKDQYPYSTIMHYNLLTKKTELIYKFDKDYSFDMESFGLPLLSWEYSWPSGLLGKIYLKGKEEDTFTFLINDKKLVYWTKGDYTTHRSLPSDGLIKK